MIETQVHRKKTKLPTPWTSNIPKRHAIKAELYWAKCVSSNFTNEISLIENKSKLAGYLMCFVNSVINKVYYSWNKWGHWIHHTKVWLFKVKYKIVLAEMLYYLKSESSSKQFIRKFDKFTNDIFDARIKWLIKKVKTWFRVKDKSLHQACKTYKGVCSCGKK